MRKPFSATRTVDAVFGAFFVAVAVVILVVAWDTAGVGALAAALLVGLLGIEALVSAARGRRPLVARIGPLP